MKRILSEYNPLTEALFLLETVAVSEGKEARINEVKRRCHHDLSKDILKKLDLVNRAEDELLESLKYSLDELKFYFKPFSKEERGFLSQIILLYAEHPFLEYTTVDQWIDDLEKKDSDEYYDTLGRVIFSYNQNVNDTLSMKQCKCLEDVLRLVLEMDFPAEEKLLFQDVILNKDKHLKCVKRLIEASLLVVDKFEKELTAYAKDFYDYWSKIFENRDFVDYLNQEAKANIQLEKNALGWKLRPAFFQPMFIGYALSIDDETGEYLGEDNCTLGFLYGDDFSLSDTSLFNPTTITEDQALKLLKLLSDKSKFDILSYTSGKNAYGAELAEMLGLTTATVSYHTSELTTAGLLNMEKQGNKIYYCKNQQIIDNLLEYLQKRL